VKQCNKLLALLVDLASKHFDFAQCDMRVWASLILINTFTIKLIGCPPEL